MPPRTAQPPTDSSDPDGLMAAAKAIGEQPETPQPPVNPLPPVSIESAIQPVAERADADELNIYERRAMAAMALRLVENEAFKFAVNAVRRRYFGILLEQRIGSADYLGAVSRAQTALVLLDDVQAQLGVVVEAAVFDERAGAFDMDERARTHVDNAVRSTVKGSR